MDIFNKSYKNYIYILNRSVSLTLDMEKKHDRHEERYSFKTLYLSVDTPL